MQYDREIHYTIPSISLATGPSAMVWPLYGHGIAWPYREKMALLGFQFTLAL